MTVDELLNQLEFDLEESEWVMSRYKVDYEHSLKSGESGYTSFYYGQYEKAFGECEKLRSAPSVIQEQVTT